MSVPVAEVTLEGKQVLVKTLDGLLLQDVVDAISSVQHTHLHLGLLLLLWLRGFWNFMFCGNEMTSETQIRLAR